MRSIAAEREYQTVMQIKEQELEVVTRNSFEKKFYLQAIPKYLAFCVFNEQAELKI